MTRRMDWGLPGAVFGLWVCVILVASPVDAQATPGGGEPATAEISPELAELERKVRDARSRLEEWQGQATKFLLAGQEAQPRTQVIEATLEAVKDVIRSIVA